MVEERKQRENRNKRKAGLEVGLVATLILLLFRIPLAKIIGDEGNGYLAISWEIYSIFYLCSYFFSFSSSETKDFPMMRYSSKRSMVFWFGFSNSRRIFSMTGRGTTLGPSRIAFCLRAIS